MFDIDDFKDRVSDFNLKDIIQHGFTEKDYEVDYTKHEQAEINSCVWLKINQEMLSVSVELTKSFNCTKNILYKAATKLGAMLLVNDEDIQAISRVVSDIRRACFKSLESGDIHTAEFCNDCIEKICRIIKDEMPKRFDCPIRVYPLPKWRLVLDKLTIYTIFSRANIYRFAILYAFSTVAKTATFLKYKNKVNLIRQKVDDIFSNFTLRIR